MGGIPACAGMTKRARPAGRLNYYPRAILLNYTWDTAQGWRGLLADLFINNLADFFDRIIKTLIDTGGDAVQVIILILQPGEGAIELFALISQYIVLPRVILQLLFLLHMAVIHGFCEVPEVMFQPIQRLDKPSGGGIKWVGLHTGHDIT